ncbi:hypothetical protein BDV96DRAFT_489979 [Lophiotrema nucula]|uniref:MARVEL domain-containing protein n=1 Tax=Lophiotrema nucula TaxID=690887 RepID=A0A6A5ZDE0_9PLEO|nr:hypothetical protein BDV96DRAFT_489979 [Lophiotrema nucula]
MLRKDRVKPTHYPILPFHFLRCAQLASSIIVAGVMSYFLRELQQDHYRLPWTFLLLLTVTVLTLLSLTGTIVLHCCYGLNPILNLGLNSVLFVLWALGFALLTWWSSSTLSHVCNRANWDTETGVSICRIYKALFSFALLGVLSTLLALALDVHVYRGSTRRGKFTALQNMDSKRNNNHEGDGVAGPIGEYGVGGYDARESNPNPMAASNNRQRQRGGEGYALPEEQFAYDEDTTYQGAAGQVGRRSIEDRI